MLNEAPVCEAYMTAKQSRDPVQVAVVSSALGLWLALLLVRWLSCWAGVSLWRWGMVPVLWPVLWFVTICLYTQSLMAIASAVAKIARFSEKTYEHLTSFLVLAGFSGVAVWDLLQASMPDRIIGGLWFAGWMVLGTVFRRRKLPSV